MYKKIFVCSNCGTEFPDDFLMDEYHVDQYISYTRKYGLQVLETHECVGVEIGMKVFKCFREVNE